MVCGGVWRRVVGCSGVWRCVVVCGGVCVCMLNLRKAGSRGAKTIISEKSKDSSCK